MLGIFAARLKNGFAILKSVKEIEND